MSAGYALKIAHGRDTIELCVAPETTVRQLKDSLQERCAAPARNMRLIFKGKMLEDNQTLSGAGLAGGARLMLLSGGAPVASAVRQATLCDCSPRLTQDARRARLRWLRHGKREHQLPLHLLCHRHSLLAVQLRGRRRGLRRG